MSGSPYEHFLPGAGASPLESLACHLSAVRVLIGRKDVSDVLGEGITRELRYTFASFRTRFPELLPGAQQRLTFTSKPEGNTRMIYQQVHGFTAAGASRFAAFLWQHGIEGLRPEECTVSCLAVIEDNLNSSVGELVWELAPSNSKDGAPHPFSVDLDDIIVETVDPER